MSPTRQLCAASGKTLEQVAKKSNLHPRYISRCVNHGCNPGTAEYLAFHLGCDDRIFLHGYRWHQQHSQSRGAGSESVDPAPRDSDFTPHVKNPSTDARRRHILKLVGGGKAS